MYPQTWGSSRPDSLSFRSLTTIPSSVAGHLPVPSLLLHSLRTQQNLAAFPFLPHCHCLVSKASRNTPCGNVVAIHSWEAGSPSSVPFLSYTAMPPVLSPDCSRLSAESCPWTLFPFPRDIITPCIGPSFHCYHQHPLQSISFPSCYPAVHKNIFYHSDHTGSNSHRLFTLSLLSCFTISHSHAHPANSLLTGPFLNSIHWTLQLLVQTQDPWPFQSHLST